VGVEIVKQAIVYGNRLSGNAYKVLVAMSMSALDKPSKGRPASLYWGGWDGLALVLGHKDAQRGGQGHKAVKRAIKELRDEQHISPMLEAHRGVAQTYAVHPGGVRKGAQDGPVKGAQDGPVKGAQESTEWGPEMGPPRSNLGQTGLTQDISLTQEPKVQTARPKAPEPHKFTGMPGDECRECGRSYGNRAVHPLHLLRGHG
jgi:hypothetical protein